MRALSYSVPGVYRQRATRSPAFPRVRTDVAGFVGVAGPNRLYQATPVDDWRSYEQLFLRDERGRPLEPPAGSRLAGCVRAFFANGGARCWVVNAAEAIEASTADALLNDMLGLPRDGAPTVDGAGKPVERTGLELLLRQEEVSIVALPELDATLASTTSRTAELPPSAEAARFTCCAALPGGEVPDAQLPPDRIDEGPLFSPPQILQAQRYLVERCEREPWRAFALLAPPPSHDVEQALAWIASLPSSTCAALYWPWLRVQERPGAPIELQSPVGFVAGVFARRDLALGPHVAPANEPLTGVIEPELQVSEPTHGRLYDRGVNLLRAFAGAGVQVWGARTLRFTEEPPPVKDPIAYVNGRRCLSAIERTVERLGGRAAFEPNTALLRANVAQTVVGYLLSVFDAGALAGADPESSFFVRCDSSNNPPGSVDAGRLVCEVGVALAAPAEFIVFRLGRAEGVVELHEAEA